MDGSSRRFLAASPALKLLAIDLPYHAPPPSSRVETLGVVVGLHRRNKFLRFLLDDGTGCVPCVLWLNHLSLPWLADKGAEVMLEVAERRAESLALGKLVGARGKVTVFRGEVQVTVEDLWEERDPNAEVLHWLDCLMLARVSNRSSSRPFRHDEEERRGRKRKGLAFS